MMNHGNSEEIDAAELLEEENGPRVGGGRRIVLLSILAVLLLTVLLIIMLPQFYIESIEITGCNHISQDELLADSGLVRGEHLFRNLGGGFIQLFTLRYGNIEKELSEYYPYINDIKIQLSFPSKVVITIDERKKIGYVEIPDGYAVIDMDGYVIELEAGNAPDGVPLMQGLPVTVAVLGEQLDMTEGKGLNSCISVLNAILLADENSEAEDFSLMKCVQRVRSVESGTTFITLLLPASQKEMLVRIGSLKNINEDMRWLAYAAKQNKFDTVGEGVLDMSGEEYTFRPMN